MTSTTPSSPSAHAWGIGLSTLAAAGSVPDDRCPAPQLGEGRTVELDAALHSN